MSRFNTPPGWPPPPAGWTPPPGWLPDPSWPPAPVGWQFWLDDPAGTVRAPARPEIVPDLAPSDSRRPRPHDPPKADSPSGAPAVSHRIGFAEAVAATPRSRRGGLTGLLGANRKSIEEENAYLKSVLAASGALSATQIAAETAELHERLVQTRLELSKAQEALGIAKADLVQTDEIAQLQEAGIYQYAHPLADAVGYKDLLDQIKANTKALIKAGRAVDASTTWQVNGSAAQGRKMVADFSKLLLRAYNAEADNCVRTVKPASRKSSMDRLAKAEATIARLGRTMNIHITSDYHRLRLYEIELTADYLAKVEEERERTRAERERMRDEAAAAREIEREKARLAKEQAHYSNALAKALSGGDAQAAEDLKVKLAEIGGEIDKIVSREANIRTGWVYVISNIGAFGENMVKIGLTRRLEPMDRVRELGDASVPFRFDVHALIFSEDAVTLETRLHQALADRKVNTVNNAREFFYATPAHVKALLGDLAGQHLLEYKDEPEAAEWRASGSRRATDFTF